MIKRVELQHKVKYLGKEYSVILHNDSDFTTAFKTLQHLSGKFQKNEVPVIYGDASDYNRIFIQDGDSIVHFYAYDDGNNEKARTFVDDMLNKHNVETVFLFVVSTKEDSLLDIKNILDDLCKDDEQWLFYMSADEKAKKTSVRIVAGI